MKGDEGYVRKRKKEEREKIYQRKEREALYYKIKNYTERDHELCVVGLREGRRGRKRPRERLRKRQTFTHRESHRDKAKIRE